MTKKSNKAELKTLGFIATFATVGAVIAFIGAAGSTTVIDPTTGTIQGASVVADSSAHQGNYIEFSQQSDDQYPPATFSQLDSPEIPTGSTVIPGIPEDPADSANNTVIDVACPVTADCAATINNAITATSARPLKVLVSAPHNNIGYLKSTIRLKDNVSIEGVNQPNLTRTITNASLFNVSGVDNVSIRKFNINIRLCQPQNAGRETIIFDQRSAASTNVHISEIKGFNGSYKIESGLPNGYDVRYKLNGSGDCVFASMSGGGEAIYIHNIAWSYTKRFVFMNNRDYTNVNIYDNHVTHQHRGFVELLGVDSVDGLRIQNNTFTSIAFGHKNTSSGDLRMVEFGGTSTTPQSRNVVITGNTIASSVYQTPRFFNWPSQSIVESRTYQPLAEPLLFLRSVSEFEVSGNTFADSSDNGIVVSSNVSNGRIENNTFNNIPGQDIAASANTPASVIIRNN